MTLLTASLSAAPDPTGPARKTLAPIVCSTGISRSKTAGEAPTITVNVPALAVAVLPETGASTNSHSWRARSSASRCTARVPLAPVSHAGVPWRGPARGPDRADVDGSRTWSEPREKTAVALVEVEHRRRIRDARDDHVDPGGELRRRHVRGDAELARELLGPFRRPVVDPGQEPTCGQVPRDRRSHPPEAGKPDAGGRGAGRRHC